MSRVVYALGGCLGLAVCTLLAYGDEVPRLTFAQLVDSIRANLELTQKIQSYNGKEVVHHPRWSPGPVVLSPESCVGYWQLLLRVADGSGRNGVCLHGERRADLL